MRKNKINKKIKLYFNKKKYQKLAHIFAKKSKKIKDLDTACFFATQAYIFSLESNNHLSRELFIFLKKNNRE